MNSMRHAFLIRRGSGFTLIELLVVIAIIAILADGLQVMFTANYTFDRTK